jgi:hypothetical protein
VTFTVKVTAHDTCQICNTATIKSPSENGGAEISSNQVCVSVTPTADPTGADASGNAAGIMTTGKPSEGTPYVSSSSGHDSDSATAGPIDAGPVKASLLDVTSNRAVTTASAEDTSTAEATNVNVMDGLVTADVVKGVAFTHADGSTAYASTNGSTITGLKVDVDGSAATPAVTFDAYPNRRIDLLAPVFGDGAYVETYETTRAPNYAGDNYSADAIVNMIHVHTTGGLVGAHDIVVSHAEAHSTFKKTHLCGTPAEQSVSGHALSISQLKPGDTVPSTIGKVVLPDKGSNGVPITQTGGAASFIAGSLTGFSTSTNGIVTSDPATHPNASSYAESTNVCLLSTLVTPCTVGAQFIRTEAAAHSGDGAASTATTQFVGLVVNGTPVVQPAPNTTIPIGDSITVVLNEVACDPGGTLSLDGTTCDFAGGHTGITIIGIHIIQKDANGIVTLDVRVDESHADVTDR